MLSNKTREQVGGWATTQGLAGHQLVGDEQLISSPSLVSLGFYFSVIFLFISIYYYYYILFHLLKCFSTQEFSHFYISNSLAPPRCGGQ